MLKQVNKLQKIQKVHDWRMIGELNSHTKIFSNIFSPIFFSINLSVSNNNTGAFIFLCLTNKRLKYLLLSNKFI